MGKLVYIMGKSGTGKSTSMEKLQAGSFGLINPEGKDLPFGKDAPAFRVERVVTDSSDTIVREMRRLAKTYPIVVVDDFQTVMTNEYMRRSAESGYQKWTDIGKHAWEIAEEAKKLPDNVIVYILCHTEENDNGGEKIKTLGKLLDQNVVLESKSTIVLKTTVIDGKYYFCTQNNGKDTVKSPKGMFPSYAVPNDLKYVDDTIRNYYDMTGAKTDEEMAVEHAEAAQDVVEKPSGRRARRKKEEDPKKEEALEEKVVAQMDAVTEAAGGKEELPFDEAIDAIEKTEEGPTFWHVPATDNYVMKMAGEAAPEGGVQITREEFNEGGRRIATKKDDDPVEGNMNPPTPKARRRRTRSAE